MWLYITPRTSTHTPNPTYQRLKRKDHSYIVLRFLTPCGAFYSRLLSSISHPVRLIPSSSRANSLDSFHTPTLPYPCSLPNPRPHAPISSTRESSPTHAHKPLFPFQAHSPLPTPIFPYPRPHAPISSASPLFLTHAHSPLSTFTPTHAHSPLSTPTLPYPRPLPPLGIITKLYFGM